MAARLPMMTDEEFVSLKESMRTQGLLEPIMILSKKELIVIDGRNRLKACLELGIEPEFITLGDYLDESTQRRADTVRTGELVGLMAAEQTGELEPMIRELVIMKNVLRRQLPDFAKYTQLVAIKGKPKHGGDRTTKKQDAKNAPCPPPTVTEVAKDLKVSERKVKQMIDLDKNADPEIKQELIENKITVGGAHKKMKDKEKKEPKPKKADWFEENIEDENVRFIWKLVAETTKKIESKVGLVYMEEYRKLLNRNINHLNYKEAWKQEE